MLGFAPRSSGRSAIALNSSAISAASKGIFKHRLKCGGGSGWWVSRGVLNRKALMIKKIRYVPVRVLASQGSVTEKTDLNCAY